MAQLNGETRALKILVIGAGIGGLTAAIALRNQGHDVQVCRDAGDGEIDG
jgi:2-polyprenyl-6-methoxyphenol hydroxylase-like FAD-dependent oxidoreductase